MKKWILLLALLSPAVARANTITPQFTQGSMNSTTTTTQTISETISQEVFGAEVKTWSGTNITASGDIADTATTFSMTTSRSRLSVRDNRKSSRTNRNNRHGSHYRHRLHYYFLLSLLSITPAYADTDPETNNVSNPVAAATGNVTNQAVQFQNNGAPSRQQYGPNISCNGSTMTFSPFYMGNHTKPWEVTEDMGMSPSSYTLAENWGFQINFMVPLDKSGLKQCREIAARQEEKMRLDYELTRALKCAQLQKSGFTLLPKSRVYHMCSDVVPISQVKNNVSNP